ncbi:MAG: plasmid stabilization protein [Elusimicrobia bacterium CG_4_9_14_3_um_filter_62_55]|nr:MAG: plasmid stabilization protein [Elusimicrobia bacterium CG22_combo_CG10-13_8_21_14_all_63_91]PJA11440.1 MAG: plasmid stabilization protein [Elusimicrobia bacterium CG_4_10_14_0_2_um_filter_63_34]PJB25878.1 MAG: plasmid stabilization protein [Elusimicrobia bacterium CG_4_9_14_3_um_filter_62_55]
MTCAFHPEALTEFEEAVEFYERSQTGLGWDLSIEVRCTIGNIVRHPSAWPVLEGNVRRCLTRRFPFGVIYAIEGADILILAVMHLRRHPDYWKSR